MRVLCVTNYYKPAYAYGGPARSIPAMCEGLAQAGAKVTVLTTNAGGSQRLDVPLETPVMLDGVEVRYYPLGMHIPLGRFFYSPALARACTAAVPAHDIVSIQALWSHANAVVQAACRRAKVRYVISPRSQLMPWGLQQKSFKKSLYMTLRGRAHIRAAAAMHCTDSMEAQCIDQFGFGVPTFVVPNGLDTHKFASAAQRRGALRRRLGISDTALALLFSGRLHPKKRPDLAVEALAAARRRGIDAHLLIAGPDETAMSEALRALAMRLGCADCLHLLGLLMGDAILDALGDADLLLMPSEPLSENFGMAAAEALAAGVPALVSEGVPLGAWVKQVNAGGVASCEVEAFAQATCSLLTRPSELKTMGERGQCLVREQFDISSVAGQMLHQFESIIHTGYPMPIMLPAT